MWSWQLVLQGHSINNKITFAQKSRSNLLAINVCCCAIRSSLSAWDKCTFSLWWYLTLICISFNARKVNFFCSYPKYTDTCMTMNFTTFCTLYFIRSQATFMVVYRRVRSLMRRVNMHSEVYWGNSTKLHPKIHNL